MCIYALTQGKKKSKSILNYINNVAAVEQMLRFWNICYTELWHHIQEILSVNTVTVNKPYCKKTLMQESNS